MRENILNDLTILITGGAGAIGCHIVKRLTDAGAYVAVNDIVTPRTASRSLVGVGVSKKRTRYLRADITEAAEARRLIERAVRWRGRLDVCLCHAGMVDPMPFLEVSASMPLRQASSASVWRKNNGIPTPVTSAVPERRFRWEICRARIRSPTRCSTSVPRFQTT